MLTKVLKVLFLLNVFATLHYSALGQNKLLQINAKGEISLQNPFTSALYLPFNESIQLFTDNSFSLRRIPQDSIALDSMGNMKFPKSIFTFDEDIYKTAYYYNSKERGINTHSGNEERYAYEIVHMRGCGTGGAWREIERYDCLLTFENNRIKNAICHIRKARKLTKDTANFEYYSSGKVKKIKLSSGIEFYFSYDKKKEIESIRRFYTIYRNGNSKDTSRIVYAQYRLGNDEYTFNELWRGHRYYDGLAENIPTKKQMVKYNSILQKYLVQNDYLNKAYDAENFPEKKLDRLDNKFEKIETKLENAIENLNGAPDFYLKKYNVGKLICIYYIDDLDDYTMDYYNGDEHLPYLTDSIFYDKENRIRAHIKYSYKNAETRPMRYYE